MRIENRLKASKQKLKVESYRVTKVQSYKVAKQGGSEVRKVGNRHWIFFVKK